MKRRDFLQAGVQFAAASSALPFARLAHAVGPFTDYKALVCLYMYGGNDCHNTIVPLGSEYAAYASARGGLAMMNSTNQALDNAENAIFKRPLHAIAPINTPGRSFGMHTSLPRIAGLFNAGKAAVVANVGPMIVPTTKLQYATGSVELPPALFSHSDQEAFWQTLSTDATQTGWGGRFADLLDAARVNGNSPLTVGLSLSGATPWLQAVHTSTYFLAPEGPRPIQTIREWDTYAGCTTCSNPRAVFEAEIVKARSNRFANAYADLLAQAIDAQRFLSSKLDIIPTYRSDFPGTAADQLPLEDPSKPGRANVSGRIENRLADQLRMVARIIAARGALVDSSGATPKRQLFFVSIGGFDNHGADYDVHAGLLAAIDSGVASFQAKMEALGVAQNVTLFTASEFGRTLESNGEGSDHGWGGHHFVVGGAVQGKKFYGSSGSPFPIVATGTATDVGEGRLLPTISTDEYAATLGRWFGFSKSELEIILPNLRQFQQFTNYNVGFLG